MRRGAVFWATLLVCCAFWALSLGPAQCLAAEETYDIEAGVKRVLTANPQVQSALEAIQAAIQGQRAALAAFGPTLTLGYGFQSQSTGTWEQIANTTAANGVSYKKLNLTWQQWNSSISLNQPLFTGFNLLNSYQKAALQQDQARGLYREVELTLVNTTQLEFLKLLKGREDLKVAESEVERLENQVRLSDAMYRIKASPLMDKIQAESYLHLAKQNRIAARNVVQQQGAILDALLNLPPGGPGRYTGVMADAPFDLGVEECLDAAYKFRPDVYVGVKSVQIAQKDAGIALSPIYPQVSASLNGTRQGGRPDLNNSDPRHVPEITDTNFQVTVNWLAWDWGQTLFTYGQQQANVRKLMADLANLRLTVGKEVRTVYFAIFAAKQRIDEARQAVEAAMETYRMTVARYQVNVGSSFDVLNAQGKLTESQASLTAALYDYWSARSNLYKAMGTVHPGLFPAAPPPASGLPAGKAKAPAKPHPATASPHAIP